MTNFSVTVDGKAVDRDDPFDLSTVEVTMESTASHRCTRCGRELVQYADRFEAEDAGPWVTECPEGESDDNHTFEPHDPEPMPLSWINNAAIHVDESKDDVTVSISVDDPRGAFTFSIHRVNKPDHENHGRLVLIMPYEGGAGQHAPLRQISNGGYVVEQEEGTAKLNHKGEHTDKYGNVLTVKMRVRPAKDRPDATLSGEHGAGTVVSLPKPGNDWYGFPEVRFDHDGKVRHVADTSLVALPDETTPERSPEDSPQVAAIFDWIEVQQRGINTGCALIRALREDT